MTSHSVPEQLPSLASRKRKAKRIIDKLELLHPDAECSLNYQTPLQILVATILSAQCTDARVNQVTPRLFSRYAEPADFAKAEPKELEELIKTTGFYHNKAKHIIASCQMIVEQFAGEVPADMDKLVQLPGVARKTANVVLTEVFQIPGITVDTHLGRLVQRLGLTSEKRPEKIESELMQVVARKQWRRFNHLIIFHGRRVCHARNPQCDVCPLKRMCPKIGIPNKPKQTSLKKTQRRKTLKKD